MRVGRVLLRAAGAAVLTGVAAAAGFTAALLRRRPPTSYATSLRQPVHRAGPDERDGGPE